LYTARELNTARDEGLGTGDEEQPREYKRYNNNNDNNNNNNNKAIGLLKNIFEREKIQ